MDAAVNDPVYLVFPASMSTFKAQTVAVTDERGASVIPCLLALRLDDWPGRYGACGCGTCGAGYCRPIPCQPWCWTQRFPTEAERGAA